MSEKDVLSLLKSLGDGTLNKEDEGKICRLFVEKLSETEISYLNQHIVEYFKLCKKFLYFTITNYIAPLFHS